MGNESLKCQVGIEQSYSFLADTIQRYRSSTTSPNRPHRGVGNHTLWGWMSLCYYNEGGKLKMKATLEMNLKSFI